MTPREVLAIDLMGQALATRDMSAAEMFLRDAETHLHAIMEMEA